MAEHTPVPTLHRAVYGFAFFIFFKTLFVLYFFWAFVPDSIIEETLGLTYLPDKYFALYIPILIPCALYTFGFFIYPAWNLSMLHDIDDVNTVVDCYSLIRCHYLNADRPHIGTCDRKVKSGPDDQNCVANVWHRDLLCGAHSNQSGVAVDADGTQSGIRNIAKFCDCTNRDDCELVKHPGHIETLYAQKMVPNICDMDIADICSILFRRKH